MTADEMQMSYLHRAICSQFMTASDATPIDSPSTARFDMYWVFDGAIITLISDGLRAESSRFADTFNVGFIISECRTQHRASAAQCLQARRVDVQRNHAVASVLDLRLFTPLSSSAESLRNGTLSVRLSGCLSVPSVDSISDVQLVCC